MRAEAPVSMTVLPPDDLEPLNDLSRFLDTLTAPAVLLGPDGQQTPLPLEAYKVLVDVVEAMRQGKGISVIPVDQRLTTQEAADFLGISRPTLVKMLEAGTIAFERPSGSRHRRVRLDDILRYQEQRRIDNRTALDTMAREAYDAGLYEMTPDAYQSALEAARKGR